MAILTTSIAGCSTWKTPGAWFGHESPSAEESAEKAAKVVPYYTREAGVKLYSGPSFSSSTITELPPHQKVYRSKLERGFAFISVEGNGQTGWLENSKLIWRLPESTAPPTEPAEPAAPEAPAQPIAPTPVTAEPPAAAVAKPEPATAEEAPPEGAQPKTSADGNPDANPSVFSPF